jgi:hypothetical protein
VSFLPCADGLVRRAELLSASYSYKKTIATDGIAGLYRGFLPSVVGIVVYRGLCALSFLSFVSLMS